MKTCLNPLGFAVSRSTAEKPAPAHLCALGNGQQRYNLRSFLSSALHHSQITLLCKLHGLAI
jgi:hypothetical protein